MEKEDLKKVNGTLIFLPNINKKELIEVIIVSLCSLISFIYFFEFIFGKYHFLNHLVIGVITILPLFNSIYFGNFINFFKKNDNIEIDVNKFDFKTKNKIFKEMGIVKKW